MKTWWVLLGFAGGAVLGFGQEQEEAVSGKRGRFAEKDVNRDGALSREELGEVIWGRAKGFDADGDGKLDAREREGLMGKGGRREGTQARPGGANAAFEVRGFQGTNGRTLRYSLFVPKGSVEGLPLVLCLHGAGGNTAAANLLASAEMQSRFPCVVVAPACDGKDTRWARSEFRGGAEVRSVMPELMETVDAVLAETRADRRRLYVTGQSMGGMGTWGIIASHAERFAAAVPVCGIWRAEDAPKMDGVAIWAFHGAEDKTVPVTGSRDMIEALRKAGVQPEPKYTEFSGVGHGSWDPAYAMAELWEWMFAQRRED